MIYILREDIHYNSGESHQYILTAWSEKPTTEVLSQFLIKKSFWKDHVPCFVHELLQHGTTKVEQHVRHYLRLTQVTEGEPCGK